MWDSQGVAGDETLTVWERLREYAATQSGPFTSQEVLSWFRRHAPSQANDRTVRAHVRGACWNVGNRSQFANREPFLTRLDRGLFRRATAEEVEGWRASHPTQPVGPAKPSGSAGPSGEAPSFEWHTEEHTQHLLVRWLKRQGWTIVRTANTATREHGVDVVAERDGARLGVEMKGYPSRFYVAGQKKGLIKPTTPKEQAKKWFAHALVPAMRLRTNEPHALSVMCFPDFPVYRALHAEIASSLQAADIEVWLVAEDGSVDVLS